MGFNSGFKGLIEGSSVSSTVIFIIKNIALFPGHQKPRNFLGYLYIYIYIYMCVCVFLYTYNVYTYIYI